MRNTGFGKYHLAGAAPSAIIFLAGCRRLLPGVSRRQPTRSHNRADCRVHCRNDRLRGLVQHYSEVYQTLPGTGVITIAEVDEQHRAAVSERFGVHHSGQDQSTEEARKMKLFPRYEP